MATNAVAAIGLGDTAAGRVGGSLLVLLIGAACELLNGVLVACGRLQPVPVTLGTLSTFQGVAIRVLPRPGGQVHGVIVLALLLLYGREAGEAWSVRTSGRRW